MTVRLSVLFAAVTATASLVMPVTAQAETVLIFGQQGNSLKLLWEASGVFDDAPYRVEWATFPNSPALQVGLSTGAVDIGLYGDYSQIQAQGNADPAWTPETVPYRNILLSVPADVEGHFPYVTAASAKSGITSLEETKGKRWAYSPGATNYQLYIQTLDHLGWTPADVQPVVLDNAAGAAALQAGEVDVWSGGVASITSVLANGGKVISRGNEVGLAGYLNIPARSGALEDPEKAAAIEDFAGRWVSYWNWYNANPDAVVKALGDGLKLDPDQAYVQWLHGRNRVQPITEAVLDRVQSLSEVAHKAGAIRSAVDIRVGWDERFNDIVAAKIVEVNHDAVTDESIATHK